MTDDNILTRLQLAAKGDGMAQLALAKDALAMVPDPEQDAITVLIEGVCHARMAVMNDAPDALAVLGHGLVGLSRAYGERGDMLAADECYGHALACFALLSDRTPADVSLSLPVTVGAAFAEASETAVNHSIFYRKALVAIMTPP